MRRLNKHALVPPRIPPEPVLDHANPWCQQPHIVEDRSACADADDPAAATEESTEPGSPVPSAECLVDTAWSSTGNHENVDPFELLSDGPDGENGTARRHSCRARIDEGEQGPNVDGVTVAAVLEHTYCRESLRWWPSSSSIHAMPIYHHRVGGRQLGCRLQ